MNKPRVALYDLLPEIYRIRDAEQIPPYPLKNYVALVELIFSGLHENIEGLYHDLFIETCDDWVIPYIGDLLGTSHLKGDPWTLRADVADTIALRRRKGTLGAMELLTYDLTKWGVHAKELRNNLVWSQNLNHQRPDAGGIPPYGDDMPVQFRPLAIQGGTMELRDPALIALLNTPFDPNAHTPDVSQAQWGQLRYNLPNLAIFLWRLNAYVVPGSRPLYADDFTYPDPQSPATELIGVCFHVHPLGQDVHLFNTYRYDPDRQPPVVSQVDEVPGMIHPSRLTSHTRAGCPEKYVAVETYDPTAPQFNPLEIGENGLHFHVPEDEFPESTVWTFRGVDLTHWQHCLHPKLNKYEIAIDPKLGRVIIPVEDEAQKNALLAQLRISYAYGALGDAADTVGAHPITRQEITGSKEIIDLNQHPVETLQKVLNDKLAGATQALVIEIHDSLVHDLDLSTLPNALNEDTGWNLCLKFPLTICAASGQRPIIRLKQPLCLRPLKVLGADAAEQASLDALMNQLVVRLEGIYLTRAQDFPLFGPLIARAAVHALELQNCTLEPGGWELTDNTRSAIKPGIWLANGYGFLPPADPALSSEYEAFNQTPEIILQRTVSGPLRIDDGYSLFLTESLLDAGQGIEAEPDGSEPADYALTAAMDPIHAWGPATQVNAITVLGRMRVESCSGKGGIWVHPLQVMDQQRGCIKFSYFCASGNQLPQNHACVFGNQAELFFESECFAHPAYGQLALASDYNIREHGPNEDSMGAFGFLLEAHKWRNLKIRYREFMPIGVRPLLIPVT